MTPKNVQLYIRHRDIHAKLWYTHSGPTMYKLSPVYVNHNGFAILHEKTKQAETSH